MKAENSERLPTISVGDAVRGPETYATDMHLQPLIREQLARISRSRVFSLSTRMQRFLRFVVETSLEGRVDSLKEYVIGTEVYDRKPPYEPSQDSIVRTEARRLRSKLKEYYETDGKMDPLIIGLQTRGYIPFFALREQLNSEALHAARQDEPISTEFPEVLVIVMPFDDASRDALAKDCAQAIAERIALQLTRRPLHKPVTDLPLQMARSALGKGLFHGDGI